MLTEICRKESYSTRRQAERAKKHKWLRVYRCPHCNAFHFTHANRPSTPVLSAAKVRRKLMANQAQIESQLRRLRIAEEQLQREQARARKIAEAAEQEHQQTVDALNILVERSFATTGRTK